MPVPNPHDGLCLIPSCILYTVLAHYIFERYKVLQQQDKELWKFPDGIRLSFHRLFNDLSSIKRLKRVVRVLSPQYCNCSLQF